MPDPTGGVALGLGLSAVGDFFSSDQARRDAKAANARTGIPEDITGVRAGLGSYFEDFMANVINQGAPLGITSPLVESARNSLRGILNQGASPKNLGFDPINAANIIGNAQRPVFQQDLTESLGQANASAGLNAGLRPGASSDLTRITNNVAGNATNQFHANVLGLIPELMQTQNQRAGILGSIANQAVRTGTQADYGLLPLILQYATSYPNQPAYQPSPSVPGNALGSLGDSLFISNFLT